MILYPGAVVIGDFAIISPGNDEGMIWIGRTDADGYGEGGEFKIAELQEVIRKFYEEKF